MESEIVWMSYPAASHASNPPSRLATALKPREVANAQASRLCRWSSLTIRISRSGESCAARPRTQRLTRQAQGVRDVAAGEIEWRAHVHDLNVVSSIFLRASEAVMLWNDRCWPTSPVTRVLPCRSPKRNC